MRRKITKAGAGILAAALVMSTLPCGGVQAQAAAKKPSLSATSASISVGSKLTLKVQNKAKGTTAKWKTSKKSVASVTQKGVVSGVKAGSATITCTLTTKAKKTTNLKCRVWVSGNVEVKTQTQLNKALANKNVKNITIRTAARKTYTIAEGDYSAKGLIVKAPNAEVYNSGTFRAVTIKAIKADTWHESAKGNTIKVTAPQAHIIVAEGAEADSVRVMREGSDVKIDVQGKASSVSVEEKATVAVAVTGAVDAVTVGAASDVRMDVDGSVGAVDVRKASTVTADVDGAIGAVAVSEKSALIFTGKTASIPVTVAAGAAGTSISASVPVTVEASANVSLELQKGAEGTAVSTASDAVSVEVKNDTDSATTVTTPSGEKTVNAGVSQSVTGGTAVTPSAPTVTVPPSTQGSASTTTPVSPGQSQTPADDSDGNNDNKVVSASALQFTAEGEKGASIEELTILPESVLSTVTKTGGTIVLTDLKSNEKKSVDFTWDKQYDATVVGLQTLTGALEGWVTETGSPAAVTLEVTLKDGETEEPEAHTHVLSMSAIDIKATGHTGDKLTVETDNLPEGVKAAEISGSSIELTLLCGVEDCTESIKVEVDLEQAEDSAAEYTGAISPDTVIADGWNKPEKDIPVTVTAELTKHTPTPSAIGFKASGETGLALSKLSFEGVPEGVKVVTDAAMAESSPSAIGLELTCACGKTASTIVEFGDYDGLKADKQSYSGKIVYSEDDAKDWESGNVSVTVTLTSFAGDIVKSWDDCEPDDWTNHEYSADEKGIDTTSITLENQKCVKVENGVITVTVPDEGMYYFKSSVQEQAETVHAWAAVSLSIGEGLSEGNVKYYFSQDSTYDESDDKIIEADDSLDLWLALDTLCEKQDKPVCYIIKTDGNDKQLGVAPVNIEFKDENGSEETVTDIPKNSGYKVEVVKPDQINVGVGASKETLDMAQSNQNVNIKPKNDSGFGVYTITTEGALKVYTSTTNESIEKEGAWVALFIDVTNLIGDQENNANVFFSKPNTVSGENDNWQSVIASGELVDTESKFLVEAVKDGRKGFIWWVNAGKSGTPSEQTRYIKIEKSGETEEKDEIILPITLTFDGVNIASGS